MNWCCEKEIKPLYDNIKYKDYFKPIEQFSKENNNIFSKIIKKKIVNDLVIQYYIKSTKDISFIILYPSALKYEDLTNKLIKKLEENGDIHYIKNLEINYYMAYNLIYQLYASEKRMKKNSDINYKINRLGFNINNKINNIKIIVYTLTNKERKINGQSSEFKMELRNIFLQKDIQITQYKNSDDRYPRGYDYLHINDNNNQAYEYASIFFNRNSLRFLKKQKSWKLLENVKTIKNINAIKQFMYNYSQNELEKLLIFSSGVLFAYGIREANDIDCILLETNQIKPEIIDQLKNPNFDISYKNTKEWNENWENELNSRAVLFGAKNYNDLVINPKFYFYFMGIKFLKLKLDLLLRIKRGRPAQLTDLLVIRQMFNYTYTLQIPKTTTNYDEIAKKDIIIYVNKNKYLSIMQFYLKTRYYIDLLPEQIEKWLNNDIILNNKKTNKINNEKTNKTNNKETNKINNEINNEKLNKVFYKIQDIADNKIIYPSQEELITLGYSPKIIIYSSNKPYLYPGEDFNFISTTILCNNKIKNSIKPKNNCLRIISFNLHNLISRCNQGNAPLFGNALNPFEKPRDINRWLTLFKELNADVLCLQELVPITNKNIKKNITDLEIIRNKFNFNYFNEQMENLGYKYKVIGPTNNGHFYETEQRDYYFLSNGIYSKIELIDPQIYQYKYLNRNIITATVKYNNKDIQIFNTHLEYYEDNNIILNNILSLNNSGSIQTKEQFKHLYELIEFYKNTTPNIIVCGDINLNLYKNSNNNYRYKNWEEKTKLFRENFINTTFKTLITNFSQNDQTDFIIYHNKSNLKTTYSYIVFTNISDHYIVLADFI